jgi:hypothetical protein
VACPGGSELGQEGRVGNLDLKNADLAGTLLLSLPLLAALRDLSLQGTASLARSRPSGAWVPPAAKMAEARQSWETEARCENPGVRGRAGG